MFRREHNTITEAIGHLHANCLLNAGQLGPQGTSEKYQAIDTEALLERIASELGTHDLTCETWIGGGKGTKHLVTIRAEDTVYLPDGTSAVPTLTLMNSYGGESTLRLITGTYRLVCSNGMYVGRIDAECIGRHYPGPVERVIEQLPLVAQSFETAARNMSEFTEQVAGVDVPSRNYAVSVIEGNLPARAAKAAVYAWDHPRQEDRGNNFWTLYNIMNEADRRTTDTTSRGGGYLSRQLVLAERIREIAQVVA